MTIEQLMQELHDGLVGVTPGPWWYWANVETASSGPPAAFLQGVTRVIKDKMSGFSPADVHYIVAAQPDNIRALLSEIERLRMALRPFARANDIDPALPDDTWLGVQYEGVFVAHCHARDFRAASRALSDKDGGNHG